MESSSIKIKVMHCKDLQSFNFFQKLLIYAFVSIISNDPNHNSTQKHRTPTDKEGEGNPEWNHEIKFDLTEEMLTHFDDFFINFELRHEGQYFGDKTIGVVSVPFKDLMEEPLGIVRFVNYQVESPDGSPNGMLNFSFRVTRKEKFHPTSSSGANEISGYPVICHDGYHNPSPVFQYPSYLPQQDYHYPQPSQLSPPQSVAVHAQPPLLPMVPHQQPLQPPVAPHQQPSLPPVAPHQQPPVPPMASYGQPPPPAQVYYHHHQGPRNVQPWSWGPQADSHTHISGYDYRTCWTPGQGFGPPYQSDKWR